MKNRTIAKALFAWCGIALCLPAAAQVSYSGGQYYQDFDSLDDGIIYRNYTNMPPGWVITKGSYVWTTVTNGFSNNYGTYCFSLAPGDTDQSIGLVIGTTGPASLGACFRNNTGRTLTAFTLAYFAEQWRKGATILSDQTIPFEYSLTATNLTSGTFIAVPALDMHSIYDGDGPAAALDGNAPANRQSLAATVPNLNWVPNQDLWIRWRGVSYSFASAHAMAVDDLIFRAVPELVLEPLGPGTLRISWSTNYPGYALETAASPNAPTWTSAGSPIQSGRNFEFQIPVSPTPQFFRLKLN